MMYVSTRGGGAPITLSEALARGLASDGGLYVPEQFPEPHVQLPPPRSLPDIGNWLLKPFFEGDPLEAELGAICDEALYLPAPVVETTEPNTFLLELFHGPTAAFKDFGARFLASCLAAPRMFDAPPLTILVATSGDTGSAVAAAFHLRPTFRVVVLYPDGRVSPRQAHQLGAFGDNIHSFRVAGSFDDCQALAKLAFNDPLLREAVPLSSANSISLGRLLPQMSYYAAAALRWEALNQSRANFVIPTGNLGNAMACVWARALGLPIGEIVLATNANRALPDFLASGEYRPRPAISTLANAMDVGAPSNLERLRHFMPDFERLRHALSAEAVQDAEISRVIRSSESRYGHVVCPHTATALAVIERRRTQGDRRPWIAVATAHPAKFEGVVEPLVGHPVDVPDSLAEILARPAHAEPLAADYDDLVGVLRALPDP
jgi:threonine synthase